MITIAAWKNDKSGIGHYTRAENYFKFLRTKNKKVEIFTFENLRDLFDKIKYKKNNTILIDTYVFSKKIETLLRKNFKKVIIINDYQFKLPKDFHLLDPFKFYKKIDHKNFFFGQEYSPISYNKTYTLKKTKKNNDLLIVLNNKYQKYFHEINTLMSRKFKNKIIINVKSNAIKNFLKLKKNYIVKSFVSEKTLLNYANKSKYIISPGGQTMMNLVEHNQFINVYNTSKNQSFYINELNKKKYINKIDFNKFSLKKNKIINYNKKNKKNKLLKIFTDE